MGDNKMINLDNIKKLSKAAILIRHADRDKMENLQIFQPLNEKGIENSKLLGKKLTAFDIKSIKYFSSPVDRCIETCQNIALGYNGEAIQPEISNILGEPGPFVVDRQNNSFHDMGCKEVVENQIAGNNLRGIRPTKEGSEIMMNYIKEKLDQTEDGQLLIFVSHDAIVIPFIYTYTGEKFNKDYWLNFSDGVVIHNEGKNYLITRNQKQYDAG